MNYSMIVTAQHKSALGRFYMGEDGIPRWDRPSPRRLRHVGLDHGEPPIALRLNSQIGLWTQDMIRDEVGFPRARAALDAGRPVPVYIGSHDTQDAWGRRRTENDFLELPADGQPVTVPWRIACWLCQSVPWAVEVCP